MVQINRWPVVPGILTLALVACEESITGIPEPVVEAAPVVEAVTSVAMAHDCGSLISWWPGDGNYLDEAPPIVGCVPALQHIFEISDAGGGEVPISQGGTVGFETGHLGQAFRFTGVAGGKDQFLQIRDDAHLRPENFTIDLWAQRLAAGQGGTNALIQKAIVDDFGNVGDGVSYFISWTAAGNIIGGVSFGAGTLQVLQSTKTISNNEWVHVALTVGDSGTPGGATVTLYVNGVEQGSYTGPANASPDYQTGSIIIGNMWMQARVDQGFHRTFNGCIDEIRLFGLALEPGDIEAIYDGGDDRTCPPPVSVNTAPVVNAILDEEFAEGGTF